MDHKNSIVKYLFYKTIYQFNTIPLKLATLFFTEIGKAIQKFIWKHKSPCIAKAIMNNNNTARGTITLDLKL